MSFGESSRAMGERKRIERGLNPVAPNGSHPDAPALDQEMKAARKYLERFSVKKALRSLVIRS